MVRAVRQAAGVWAVAWLASCGSAETPNEPISATDNAGAPTRGAVDDGGDAPMSEGGAGGYEGAGAPAVSGKTLHFDGNAWQESPFPLPLNSQALFAGKTSL